MSAPMNSTNKTAELVEAWIARKQTVQELKNRLANADAELGIATNKLGSRLTPDDARPEEPFHIWFGSGILQAKMKKNLGDGSSYEVCWRKEPVGKQAMEQGV